MSDIVKGRTWISGEVVTADKINETLDDAEIGAGKVTTAKIAAGAVDATKVQDAAVTAPKLSGAQTGSAPVYGVRAWVKFNGVSGVVTLGGNVSSITKAGTGLYLVNFTTALPNANCAFAGAARLDAGVGVSNLVVNQHRSALQATTGMGIACQNLSGSFVDGDRVFAMFIV